MEEDVAGETSLMVLDIMSEEEEALEMDLLPPSWIISGMVVGDLVLRYLETMEGRQIIINLVDAFIRRIHHRNRIQVDQAVATCFLLLTMNLHNLNQI